MVFWGRQGGELQRSPAAICARMHTHARKCSLARGSINSGGAPTFCRPRATEICHTLCFYRYLHAIHSSCLYRYLLYTQAAYALRLACLYESHTFWRIQPNSHFPLQTSATTPKLCYESIKDDYFFKTNHSAAFYLPKWWTSSDICNQKINYAHIYISAAVSDYDNLNCIRPHT